jgi:two-component system, LuxR family, response regulator FixJ
MSISHMIVYVVEEDARLDEGFELLLRSASLEPQRFNSGQAFLDAYPTLRPGCLFVDLALSGMSGLDLLNRLHDVGCRWPVVVLTGRGSSARAEEVMRAGAFALLEKPPRELELLATMKRAQAYLSRVAQTTYDEEIAQRIQRLSRREREVFEGVLQGLLNKQIAAKLGISESTVKSARRALMGRLQAGTSLELIAIALRGGLTIKTRS